jgi:fibronectin type 3 domain-containing protein
MAVAASSTEIKLTWTDVSEETGYTVERSLDGLNWVEVAAAAMDAVTYTDTGLTPGTKYWYRLRAVNQGGESLYSPEVGASTKLLAPQGVTAAAITPTSVQVKWSPVTGAASYLIQRSLNGKTWTDLTRVSRTTSTYTDYGVSANTSYSYRIVAVALDGTRSELSSVVSVRTKKK